MIRYPNQSLVTIQNESFEAENSKDNPYGLLRVSSSRKAATELSGTAYKIFVDLALNKDGYKMALSPEAYYQELGISKGSYKSARKELIELGYLYPEPSKEDKNAYIFTPNPPRAQARVRKSKSTKNVPLNEADEKQQNNVENDMGQKMTSKSTKNSLLKGQKMTHESTGNDQETIQDGIYNTDNTYVSGAKNDSCVDVNDFSLDEDISNENNVTEDVSIGLAFDDTARAWRVRRFFRETYKKRVDAVNKDVGIRAILDTYLSTHPETETLKRLRRKYGVWIRGWDNELQQPKICYLTSPIYNVYLYHDTKGIPYEYWRDKAFELNRKPITHYKGKPVDSWSIFTNRYTVQEPIKFTVSENEPFRNDSPDVTGADSVPSLDEDISRSSGADELMLDDTDDEEINHEDLIWAMEQNGDSNKYLACWDDDLPF